MSDMTCDVLVIGGGMGGASVAAHLAPFVRVQIIEMENHAGYHSTGRSAALFSESYGNDIIRDLTKASRRFLFSPPAGFSETPLTKPRPVLIAARASEAAALDEFAGSFGGNGQFGALSAAEAHAHIPILRTDRIAGALLDNSTADIDVDALHQGFLRIVRAHGGKVIMGAPLTHLSRDNGQWIARAGAEAVRAKVIVNAAGAWANEVAAKAGAINIGMVPLRRTAMLLDPPPDTEVDTWPMLLDAKERFYMKPDAGLLLLSPADETPSPPCDAQPDDLDVAIAIDELERVTSLAVRRVRHKWAGLRCFVNDRSPVVGFDPLRPGFFWHAALGGYGIQTAPALGRMAARLILEQPMAMATIGAGIIDAISPLRLTTGDGDGKAAKHAFSAS